MSHATTPITPREHEPHDDRQQNRAGNPATLFGPKSTLDNVGDHAPLPIATIVASRIDRATSSR